MNVPTPIAIGAGVTTAKRSSGGVIASRLNGSAKNAKTASSGASTTCSRRRVWMGIIMAGTDERPAQRTGPAPARRRPRPRPRRRRRWSSSTPTSPARAARSTRSACAREGARVVFRHFALKAKHERAVALAQAAEAAARQGAFWAFHDALYADQGRLDDPHLWARCETLGLDLERFEADRRDPAIAERVRRDVRDALRAGATTTPTLFQWPVTADPQGSHRGGAQRSER